MHPTSQQRAESYISYLGIYQPAIFSCGSMLPLCKGHHEKASGVRACVYWYSSIPYPFSSPTHQHSAHHPSRHPTKGNYYRDGTERNKPHDGAKAPVVHHLYRRLMQQHCHCPSSSEIQTQILGLFAVAVPESSVSRTAAVGSHGSVAARCSAGR